MSLSLALLQSAGDAASAATGAAGDAVQETWRLMDLPALWVVVLILVPGAFGVAYLAYWRESISSGARWTMVTLRALSFLLLIAVLARPVHVLRQPRRHDAAAADEDRIMRDAARRVPAARRERRRSREGELRPAHDAPYDTQLVGAGRAVREADAAAALELLGPVWKSTSENISIEQTQ